MPGKGRAALALALLCGALGPLAAVPAAGPASAQTLAPADTPPAAPGQPSGGASDAGATAAAGPSAAEDGPASAPAGVPAAAGVSAGTGPFALATAPAGAVLTVDQEALYTESRWGKRAQDELQARSREVAAENDRIVAQLEAEDDALTALRPTLPVDEFRRRADAFDARVQQVRKERDDVVTALAAAGQADRTAFLNAVLPIVTTLMRERGAGVILDQRTVFLSSAAVDVTGELVARIDASLGAGPPLPSPDATASDPQPSAPPQDQMAP